jgi:endo-1,4-beta-mannosidase
MEGINIMIEQNKFVLGINYWPAMKAMYWWKSWDKYEVEADFSRIAESNFDVIRFFLMWEDFQPEHNVLSIQSLKNLEETLNIAEKYGLSTMPTFFSGHMSGLNWIPEWMISSDEGDQRFDISTKGIINKKYIRNYFNCEELIKSQIYQLSGTANAIKGHPALWGWDLGNEPSNCIIPENKQQGSKWLKRMLETLKAVDERIPVTIGMHMEDLEENRNLGPAEAGEYCDFICMHGYPIYTKWSDGPTDPNLLPFLAIITRWLGKKPVLLQEFGLATNSHPEGSVEGQLRNTDRFSQSWEKDRMRVSTNNLVLVSEEEAAEYYSRVLNGLYQAGCTGAFAWCYSDYNPNIWHLPPLDKVIHERYFGLWRHNGEKKMMLEAIENFQKREILRMDNRPSWIDINEENFYKNPLGNIKKLYGKYKSKI